MIRVLHLICYSGIGGVESYIISLVKKMKKMNCEFYFGYTNEGPLQEKIKELNVETIKIIMKRPYDLKAAKQLAKICEERNIDIVHTHYMRENFIGVFSKLFGNKSKIVRTQHILNEKSKLLKFIEKIMYYYTNKTIAVSKTTKEYLINSGVQKKSINLIYNGVEKKRKEVNVVDIREELNINNDDYIITSVSRFTEEKGHFFLLEVIKRVVEDLNKNSQKQKVKFLLVGGGELLEEVKKLAKKYRLDNEVVFTGFREDVNKILEITDIYVAHSKSEALQISILEALLYELPIISTDSGGPSEIINQDKKCGILVEYGDVKGFAESIIELMNNKAIYEKLKKNASYIVNDSFSLDKMASETLTLYQEL